MTTNDLKYYEVEGTTYMFYYSSILYSLFFCSSIQYRRLQIVTPFHPTVSHCHDTSCSIDHKCSYKCRNRMDTFGEMALRHNISIRNFAVYNDPKQSDVKKYPTYLVLNAASPKMLSVSIHNQLFSQHSTFPHV